MFQAAYCGGERRAVSIDEPLALEREGTHVIELEDKDDKVMSARAAGAQSDGRARTAPEGVKATESRGQVKARIPLKPQQTASIEQNITSASSPGSGKQSW